MARDYNKILDRLSKQEKLILKTIYRYRLATSLAITKCFFVDKHEKTILRYFVKLENLGLIARANLIKKKAYFHLTRKGTRIFNAPDELGEPLGQEALPSYYAKFLYFMRKGGRMFTPEELAEYFPTMVNEGFPTTRHQFFYPRKNEEGDYILYQIGSN